MTNDLPKVTKIKAMREARGWSQHDLAMRVLVTRQSIDLWERGVNSPTLVTARRLANTFGCTIDDLID